MDYIIVKFNFLNIPIEIYTTVIYTKHYFQIEFQFQLKLQFEISNCNFNLQLKLNVGEILENFVKRESGFYLAYGLHCCQIQFQLQIEIAIWNLKLQFQFANEIQFENDVMHVC